EEAGADAIFAEAMTELSLYRTVCETVDIPVLANITEFGKTNLYDAPTLASTGIKMALYPLSAFRAQSKATLEVFTTIRESGTQRNVIDSMQTREELYEVLGYHDYEQTLDRLFSTD
ncbi:MAG: methylisocitrate lyase, partial [Gammaproteobacteria bacterium]|nr:methylisocitrate lyase [Gammaproteobacteria bacterium]